MEWKGEDTHIEMTIKVVTRLLARLSQPCHNFVTTCDKVMTILQGGYNLVTTLYQTGHPVLRLSQGCDKVVGNLQGCNKQVTTL